MLLDTSLWLVVSKLEGMLLVVIAKDDSCELRGIDKDDCVVLSKIAVTEKDDCAEDVGAIEYKDDVDAHSQ